MLLKDVGTLSISSKIARVHVTTITALASKVKQSSIVAGFKYAICAHQTFLDSYQTGNPWKEMIINRNAIYKTQIPSNSSSEDGCV